MCVQRKREREKEDESVRERRRAKSRFDWSPCSKELFFLTRSAQRCCSPFRRLSLSFSFAKEETSILHAFQQVRVLAFSAPLAFSGARGALNAGIATSQLTMARALPRGEARGRFRFSFAAGDNPAIPPFLSFNLDRVWPLYPSPRALELPLTALEGVNEGLRLKRDANAAATASIFCVAPPPSLLLLPLTTIPSPSSSFFRFCFFSS